MGTRVSVPHWLQVYTEFNTSTGEVLLLDIISIRLSLEFSPTDKLLVLFIYIIFVYRVYAVKKTFIIFAHTLPCNWPNPGAYKFWRLASARYTKNNNGFDHFRGLRGLLRRCTAMAMALLHGIIPTLQHSTTANPAFLSRHRKGWNIPRFSIAMMG